MKFTLEGLQTMPTIKQGHTDDLKMEFDQTLNIGKTKKTVPTRVWLSRLTVADGMPYDNQVTIEVLNNVGAWVTLRTFQAA